ncbi:hypothetical protein [Xanthomonas sacchari]|nr:hypothetical protein [Xanthomonas sacchari]MCW0438048.1 hypothetical protein [Xanthomonas sacchari]
MKTSHAVAVSAAIGLGLATLLVGLLVGGGRWLLRVQHHDTPTATTAAPVADAEQLATQALAPYQARLQATRRPVLQVQLQPMT